MIITDYKIITSKNHTEVENQVKVLLDANLGWEPTAFVFNNGFFIQTMQRKEKGVIIHASET